MQAVINPGFGQGPAIVTRNYRQLGITAPLYQSHGVGSKQFIDLAGDAANGVRLPAAALLVARKAAGQRSAEEGRRRLQESTKPRPAAGFDLRRSHVRRLHDHGRSDAARRRCQDKAKVRDEIEKTKNFIGTGGVVNMSPTDHLGLDLIAFRMLEIKNGDWALAE